MIVDNRTTFYDQPAGWTQQEHETHGCYASNALATGHSATCEKLTRARNWPMMGYKPRCTCAAASPAPVDPARSAPVQETIILTIGAADAAAVERAWAAVEDALNAQRDVSYLSHGRSGFAGGVSRPGIRLP